MFLKNCWYVAAWSHELEGAGPIGRVILGEPVAMYRKGDGTAVAVSDRCAHRHAPLSKGRVEGDALRCLYHGLKFDAEGGCIEGPGIVRKPPGLRVRTYRLVEQDSWIWIWMGDAEAADPDLIPRSWGLDTPAWTLTAGQIDYEANYQLINDNLTDLSHVDFVHETTLGRSSGGNWSTGRFTVTPGERSLHFARWFVDQASASMATGARQDVYNEYSYTAPGVFIMRIDAFPLGTAKQCEYGRPDLSLSLNTLLEQQAVTPIDERRTRYLFATGISRASAPASPEAREMRRALVEAAFAEDKEMIEAQQKIIDLTPAGIPMGPLPQDRGPMLMRSLLMRLIKAEAEGSAGAQVNAPQSVEKDVAPSTLSV